MFEAWARPRLERVPADVGVLTTQGGDIRAVVDAIEPLKHQGKILAPGPAGLNRELDVLDGAPGDARQDLRHLTPRQLVRGDVDTLAEVQLAAFKHQNREAGAVHDYRLLQLA
jgi:hypothetical protein